MKTLLIVLAAVLGVASQAHAACTSSTTHFCIDHDGVAYTINGGAEHQTLALTVGTTYTFEASTANLASHPFIITDNATGTSAATPFGASQGVTGGPLTALGDSLTYTPIAAQVGTQHYQCHVHPNMGGNLTITSTGGAADGASTPIDMATSPTPAASSGCSMSSGAGWSRFALLLALGLASLLFVRSRRARA